MASILYPGQTGMSVDLPSFRINQIPPKNTPYVPNSPSKIKVLSDNDLIYDIPGVGNVSNESCGTVQFVDRCPNHSHKPKQRLVFYTCHNYQCPECYRSAAHRAGERIEDRLAGISQQLRHYGVKTGYPVHVVLSPAEGAFNPADSVQKMRGLAYKYAQEIGMIGGVLVFHPYRINDNLTALLVEYNNGVGVKSRPFWQLVHEDVLQLGSWKNYVYWSPHFHIIGYFPTIKIDGGTFQRSHDWIYTNLGVTKSICGTASYLLTHHAYTPGNTGYTYFGHFAYSRAKIINSWVEKEPVVCPICDTQFERWSNFDIIRNHHGYKKYDFSTAKCHGPVFDKKKVNIYKLTKWIIKEIECYFKEPEVSKNAG